MGSASFQANGRRAGGLTTDDSLASLTIGAHRIGQRPVQSQTSLITLLTHFKLLPKRLITPQLQEEGLLLLGGVLEFRGNAESGLRYAPGLEQEENGDPKSTQKAHRRGGVYQSQALTGGTSVK